MSNSPSHKSRIHFAARRRVASKSSKAALGSFKSSEIVISMGLALIVGSGGAAAAYIFRNLIQGFQYVFFDRGQDILSFAGDYYVIVIPAIGGAIVGPIIYFFAKEAKGHGVPEVMAAIALQGGKIRPRVVVVKALASALTIGSGGSVGREGPIVHVGSAIGSVVAQKLKLSPTWTSTLVASGAAAGISATFNAPLAGIFFAMEVILRKYESRTFIVVVLSSVVASAITQSFFGNQPAFSVPIYELVSPWEFVFYSILGVLAAITGHGFVTILYATEDLFEKIKSIPSYLMPIIGGLIVGTIGLFYPQVFGVGYEVIDVFDMPLQSIDGALVGALSIGLMAALLFVKIVATSVTLGSGGSGGVFAPSLFIGVMLGGIFGAVVHSLFPDITASSGAYALVGMAAVFAAGARAPATAIIILFEMTRDYKIIVPLMTAVVIAVAVAQGLRKANIYTIKLLRRGVDIDGMNRGDLLEDVLVGDVMTRDYPTVTSTITIAELADKFAASGHHGFPVVDSNNDLTGIITITDLEKVQRDPSITVDEITTHNVIVVYTDQSLKDVLSRFGARDLGRYPVVSRDNPKKLLGVLRRRDIIMAYAGKVNSGLPSDLSSARPE
ncbi:MAG: chloride channel protein [Chloroflexi bacterium]|nr:chloride channel protein [Chloroflexota bacterium]